MDNENDISQDRLPMDYREKWRDPDDIREHNYFDGRKNLESRPVWQNEEQDETNKPIDNKSTDNFEIQDPLITINTDFYINYSGIDRKIVYKDVDISHKQSGMEKLKERALRDWGIKSKKFETEFNTSVGDLGVMIYTTINNSRVLIMAGQGENKKEADIFFNLLGKSYKTKCGLTIKSGNEFRTFKPYSQKAIDYYIHAVEMNIAVKDLDS